MSTTKPVAPPNVSQNQQLMLNLALKMNSGLVAAGLVSLLVARRAGGRLFITGAGAGAGVGYAWCQNDFYLKDPKSTQLPRSFQSEFDRCWQVAAEKVPSFAKFK